MPHILSLPTLAELRSMVGTEYQAASEGIHAEIHKFLDFVDFKSKRLAEAKALLEANGFVVSSSESPPAAS